ncbi:hypothetical protein SPRG_11475 [Saprolegnia parasitica CBS 223.65]|uniref:Elicitin n=1 Tax=Saprolegnia parasitica (strain CBS 223.65) TaxID=695850 RepID=A0A067BYN2_SAPPC|nr:hypothetical protein SPRG_11475 [Saprolegnia parasitica CBS 223.65]KDO23383.1 hypothetical protein SPRG_11475 [Saprolegnia parasitica CBS 223.65]|eukprot:XP_012205873.1 hypothetical protein SPRG_11475 [Saprolegnia parasitica CBS 223.65]
MTACNKVLHNSLATLSVQKGFGNCRFLRGLSLDYTDLNDLANDCTLSPTCVKLITTGFLSENLIGCNVTDVNTNYTMAISDFSTICSSPTKLSAFTKPPTTMPRPVTTGAPNTTTVATTTRPLSTTEAVKPNATNVTSFAAPTGPTVKATWSLLVCLALLLV